MLDSKTIKNESSDVSVINFIGQFLAHQGVGHLRRRKDYICLNKILIQKLKKDAYIFRIKNVCYYAMMLYNSYILFLI